MFSRVPKQLTPRQFEDVVAEYFRNASRARYHQTPAMRVLRREKIERPDGTFELDVTVRFQVLDFEFLMLVECKHQSRPVKRDVLEVLLDKVHAVGAHKGAVFSTSGFQSGSLKYAAHHGIALVDCKPGRRPTGVTKGTSFGAEGDELSTPIAPGIAAPSDWVLHWNGLRLNPLGPDAARILVGVT